MSLDDAVWSNDFGSWFGFVVVFVVVVVFITWLLAAKKSDSHWKSSRDDVIGQFVVG